MYHRFSKLLSLLVIAGLCYVVAHKSGFRAPTSVVPPERDIVEIRQRQSGPLAQELASQGMELGAPVHVRIFKEEAALELWVLTGGQFELFRTYPVCNYSGDLGPKLKQGDKQSPEGIYLVSASSLNPNSRFHLSFNLGYPNAFDRSQGRTGDFLMVHGDCVSVGCYAMTDPAIEEIYVIVEAALRGGQRDVAVHAFPFRMTDERLFAARSNNWHGFWSDLKPIHDYFERTGLVPDVTVSGQRYLLAAG